MDLMRVGLVVMLVLAGRPAVGQFRPGRPQPGRPSPARSPEVQPPSRTPGKVGYDELVTRTVAAIQELKGAATVRVGALVWTDDTNGQSRYTVDENTDYTLRFVDSLKARANGFSVLGPKGLAQERAARGKVGTDTAELSFDRPDTYAHWLKETFRGEIFCVLVGRMESERPALKLVAADGRVKPITLPDGMPGPSKPGYDPPHLLGKAAVIPDLFVTRDGWKEPRKLTLYVLPQPPTGSRTPPLVAPLGEDLSADLAAGKLRLEIGLRRGGGLPDSMVDNGAVYGLAADPTRLTTVAVSIDLESVVDVVARHHRNNQQLPGRRPAEAQPQEAMRKFVLSPPGTWVEGTHNPRGYTVRSGGGKDHSRRRVQGFQSSDTGANQFILRPPTEGAAALYLDGSPGVVKITTFVERKRADVYQGHVTSNGGSGGGVAVERGAVVESNAFPIEVDCYPTPVEEHVILLRTTLQCDPVKEKLEPFPVTR